MCLFGALLLVVVGSLAGEWLSIQHKLGNLWFWFGTQGYEYVDLGRFWQILLFVGLSFWLWLMWRAIEAGTGQARSKPLAAVDVSGLRASPSRCFTRRD